MRAYVMLAGGKSPVMKRLADKLTKEKGLTVEEWDYLFVRYHSIDTGVIREEAEKSS